MIIVEGALDLREGSKTEAFVMYCFIYLLENR